MAERPAQPGWWRGRGTPLRAAFHRPWPGTLRGLCLWLLALAVGVLGGVNYIATEPADLRPIAFALELSGGSVDFWGWVMLAVAAFALYSSYCHFGRDKVGFVVVATFCGAWGMDYIAGWLFFGAGLRAFGGAAIWLFFAGLVAAIARFPSIPFHDDDLDEVTR